MTLYLTVDLTFPDPVDLSAPPVSDASSPFYGGATFDFTMETTPESDPLENTPDGIGQQGIQLSENTVRYMLSITYRQPVLTPGKEVTLSLSNPYGETSTHLFHWTVETQASSLPSPPVSPYRRGTHWTRMPSRKAPLSWMPPDSPSRAFNYPA